MLWSVHKRVKKTLRAHEASCSINVSGKYSYYDIIFTDSYTADVSVDALLQYVYGHVSIRYTIYKWLY